MKIVFLHGFGSTSTVSTTGRGIRRVFADQDVACLDYDSITPAQDMPRLQQEIEVYGDVVLIGVSLGGFLARYLASKCLNVKRLILLNPAIGAASTAHTLVGQEVHGRIVPEDFYQQFKDLLVEQDRKDLAISVVLCTDDEVVDPQVTLDRFSRHATLLLTQGGHTLPFLPHVNAFIRQAAGIEPLNLPLSNQPVG